MTSEDIANFKNQSFFTECCSSWAPLQDIASPAVTIDDTIVTSLCSGPSRRKRSLVDGEVAASQPKRRMYPVRYELGGKQGALGRRRVAAP